MRKFFNELNEATTMGSGEISGDDDLPTGTTVFGDKMVPVVVPNRLTGSTIKYVPADELGQEWNYDEFENSQAMGSIKAYSKTLDDLDGMLGGRLFNHTDRRKFRLAQDKWIARKGDQDGGGVSQTAKLSDDDEETMHIDITERINQYVGDTVEQIDEEIVNPNDRKTISRAIMSGKNAKIVVKSLNLQANMTNYDDEVIITYTKSEDFTLTLVDIADTLGMDFKITKDGGKQAFRMIK